MLSAHRFLPEAERGTVGAAVAAAEASTAAEIVCAVSTESGRYDRAEGLVGLVFSVLALWGAALVADEWAPGGWTATGLHVGWQVFAVSLGYVVGNLVASYVHPVRRLVTSAREMEDEVGRAAALVYAGHKIGATRGCGGVLIYVSLFERRVAVLADKAVMDRLGQTFCDAVRDVAVAGLKAGERADVLVRAVEAAAGPLTETVPATGDAANELSDEVILIHPRP